MDWEGRVMDKTEQFIKMADCPEIQGEKEEFINGDWFAYYDPKAYGERGDLCIGVVGTSYYEFTRKYVKKWDSLATVGFDEGDSEPVWNDKIIWLPRQDDIQKMINFKYAGPGYVRKLWDFALDESETRAYNSFEQLWLAFYMHEKHSKRWSFKEEKWLS